MFGSYLLLCMGLCNAHLDPVPRATEHRSALQLVQQLSHPFPTFPNLFSEPGTPLSGKGCGSQVEQDKTHASAVPLYLDLIKMRISLGQQRGRGQALACGWGSSPHYHSLHLFFRSPPSQSSLVPAAPHSARGSCLKLEFIYSENKC